MITAFGLLLAVSLLAACDGTWPMPTDERSAEPPDCRDSLEAALKELEQADWHAGCTDDADCVLVDATFSCPAGNTHSLCPMARHAAKEAAFIAAHQVMVDRMCDPALGACNSASDCPAELKAACVMGSCRQKTGLSFQPPGP